MKATWFILLGFFGAALASTHGSRGGDRTITKVVKLLQKMLEKSKQDAEDDRKAYAKYKCYVDINEEEKTASIKKLGEQIDLLESKIAELQARNGELSNQVATLTSDMTANEVARKTAKGVRDSSQEAFEEMEKDLQTGIGQMEEALDVLSSISLTQMDTKKRASLLSMGSKARQSLNAAKALLPPESQKEMEALLQGAAPKDPKHAGGAIVGVLQSLLDTFKGNLENAQKSNKAEKEAFEKSQKVLEGSYEKMKKSLEAKKSEMGDNDGTLGDSKDSLVKAQEQKADDEDFLAELLKMGKKKARNYDERTMLRANEDAAIAEAISILNSDEAFDSFGKTDATSTGETSFLQLRQLRGGAQQQAEAVLENAAHSAKSLRLARVATGLRSGHAFTTVLDEIKQMKKTIAEEGEADHEKKTWCEKERENSNKDLEAKKDQIKDLESSIEELDTTINDPKTGLLVQISDTEDSLVKNQKSQDEETATRKEENAAYKEDVSNLSDAEDILKKAVKVLKRYYDKLAEHMEENKGTTDLIQEDPKIKSDVGYGDFEGQSESGGKAIEMIEFILKETETEHKDADDSEEKSAADYKESMEKLKKAQEQLGKDLVGFKEDLAEAEKTLVEKKADLKDTTAAKEAIEKYLLKIKPGCDFIMENFELREKNRETETTALEKAEKLIKDTPAYKDAIAAEEELASGKCKSACKLDTTSLNCKVCMSGKTKAAYCADEPGTLGCK